MHKLSEHFLTRVTYSKIGFSLCWLHVRNQVLRKMTNFHSCSFHTLMLCGLDVDAGWQPCGGLAKSAVFCKL